MLILLAAGFMSSFPAAAAGEGNNSPLGIGLFPPLQFPGTDFGITGLRLSAFGLNRAVHGLDFGVIGNVTKQSFKGLAVSGLFNDNRGSSVIVGLQVAALANINSGQSDVYGIQVALFNSADRVWGLQLGLINVATVLRGFQLGLININKMGPFKASPIINAAF